MLNIKIFRVIILIGLPGSGKSTYIENNIDIDKYLIFDDFLDQFFNDQIVEKLINGENVCLSDPRLCSFNTYLRVVRKLEKFISKDQIYLLLFENDKDKCLRNNSLRNNSLRKRIEIDINNFSLVYNLSNYSKYQNTIVKCY